MGQVLGAAEQINHDGPRLAAVPDRPVQDGNVHAEMARIADVIVENGEGLTLESLIKAFWRTYSTPEGAEGNIVSIHEARSAAPAPVVAEDAFARLASRMDRIAEGLGFVAERIDRVEGRDGTIVAPSVAAADAYRQQTGSQDNAPAEHSPVPARRRSDEGSDAARDVRDEGPRIDIGLPDRAQFELALQENFRIARSEVEPLSVAICSISRIETIVERHGLHTATRLMERIARTLSHATKGECYSARKSNSEFIMLARGITLSQFRSVLEQSIADLAARRWHDKFSNEALGMIDMHIGVAHVFDFANPSFAMRAADLAHERAVLERTSNVIVADARDLAKD